jgi:hypothetical protein
VGFRLWLPGSLSLGTASTAFISAKPTSLVLPALAVNDGETVAADPRAAFQ